MPYIVKPEDALCGTKINNWTLLSTPQKPTDIIPCRCDCGNEKQVKISNILRGLSKRCRHCSVAQHRRTHGESDAGGAQTATRLYRIWKAMKWRCNPKNKTKDREQYYERGIRVCDRWINSYSTFRAWAMANGYADGLSIDRFPDKNGNYYPTNCRWVDSTAQARNTRRNHNLTAFGETKTTVEWSEDDRCLPNYGALRRRLALGWGDEDAIKTPLKIVFF